MERGSSGSVPAEFTILIVDHDEDFVADLLRLWLPKGRVVHAACLEGAPESLRGTRPDLILIDPSCPLESQPHQPELRPGELFPECPIVLVTRAAGREARCLARDFGASAVLRKPFDIRELDQLVSRILFAPRATPD